MLTNRNFLFVTCVNDEKLYERCVKHIEQLHIPVGSKVERLPIYDAASMTAGYNQAIHYSAKYKIYLHQDTFILNKNLLVDVIRLFTLYPALGMLGVVGCIHLPLTGTWWEGSHLIGKVQVEINGVSQLLRWREIQLPFEPVNSIDGLLMITQHDIPWREDLLEGFHFYDASQSLEFKKRGYIVGIPQQVEPWSLHVHTPWDEKSYHFQRKIFLSEYGQVLQQNHLPYRANRGTNIPQNHF